MSTGLLGRKVGMTQIYDAPPAKVIPVTVIQAGPCHVLQLRTADRDGYEAVQLGYQINPVVLPAAAERGQVATLDSKRQKSRRRRRSPCWPRRPTANRSVSSASSAASIEGLRGRPGAWRRSVFAEIKSVDVVGTSKGRGTAGAMKRHNFSGQRASHGVKKCHRHLGGTGCSAYPSRVLKGKKMPGRYGAARCTVAI